MAGRKDKNTVDYFPHYCVGGKTMYIIETKFGNDGYAVWFKILELLGLSENHYIDCRKLSDWEFLQAKMQVDTERLESILLCLCNADAIHSELWENRIIWSLNFTKNISDAYLRRKTECMNFYDLCKHLSIKCRHKYNLCGIIDNTNTQSKVKKSKEDKSKVNDFDFSFINSDFYDLFLKWLDYKSSRKEKYKTQESVELCYKKLLKFSRTNIGIATEIIESAMANNYAGFFEPKQEQTKKHPFTDLKNNKHYD